MTFTVSPERRFGLGSWRASLSRITSNTAATIGVRALTGVARVALIAVARYVGPQAFGRLALAVVFIELARLVADAGLSLLAIRRLARGEPPAALFGRLLTLNALLTLPVLAAALLAFRLIYGVAEPLLLVLSPLVLCGLVSATVASLGQARLRMHALLPASLAGAVATLVGVGAALLGHQPIWVVALALSFGAGVDAGASLLVARRLLPPPWPLSLAGAKPMLREALPIFLGGACVLLYSRADTLIIGRLLGQVPLGHYAAAYRLTEPFLLVLSSLAISVYASLSHGEIGRDSGVLRRELFRLLSPLLLVMFIGSLLLSLSARPIVLAIYGLRYDAAIVPFAILAWTITVKGINALLTAAVNARGDYGVIARIAVVNLLVNVTANALLIPSLGLAGAAAAVLATELLSTAFQLRAITRAQHREGGLSA